jgi:hypothetical protein
VVTSFASVASPLRQFRVDPAGRIMAPARMRAWAGLMTIAIGFVIIGGASLDLGDVEARLGLAAREGVGPFGQMYGGWEPGLWPAQVLTSQAWAWGEGGTPTAAAVRWPSAIAGVVIGLLLARRMGLRLGLTAGVWMGFCWFGTVAMIDRSAGASIDLVAALGVIGALDRILGRGSDFIAGLWAGLAFLGGGWPPLAIIALATVVIGRRGASLSLQLVLPALAAAAAWSFWALGTARAEVWAAALTLPLTRHSEWTLALGVMALGLPWSPFVALAVSSSVREGWETAERFWILGWVQVAGACLLAGTIVPGLAAAARIPALAGFAVGAAAVCERIWSSGSAIPKRIHRIFLILACSEILVWVIFVTLQGTYLAAAVSYYRPIAIVLVCAALPIGLFTLGSLSKGKSRGILGLVVAVAITLKIAHWGIYVPEWNYRFSQGPWGRAIGQFVPPNWPIYTMHTWPADLAFATGRPVRQLADPSLLQFKSQARPQFVLLHPAEFENWPEYALPLVLVREFQDERGGGRVLARTEGTLWHDRIGESE